MTAPDIAAIVRGLTRAQRKAIKNATWNDERGEWRAFAMFPADRNLRSKGLTLGMWAVLTPLGLAVRQHILKEQAS